jgi:hypothetical protein
MPLLIMGLRADRPLVFSTATLGVRNARPFKETRRPCETDQSRRERERATARSRGADEGGEGSGCRGSRRWRLLAVPEAPGPEIRRRGVPVLPPGPAPPPLSHLRERAALRLRVVVCLPVLLVPGLRRGGGTREQPHRAGAPGRAVAVRRGGLLLRRRRPRRGRRSRKRQAEGAGVGVAAVLEGRGARGGCAGRGRRPEPAAFQLRVHDGRGIKDRRGGAGAAVGVALPQPAQGVPAPEVVGERGRAGVKVPRKVKQWATCGRDH